MRCPSCLPALLVILARTALAQEGPPLEAWIASALEKNPARSQSRAGVLSAEADRLRAGAALLPTLRALGTYTRNEHATVIFFPTSAGALEEVVITARDSLEAMLVARVPLIDPPAFARWRAARLGADAAQGDDEANKHDISLLVARDY